MIAYLALQVLEYRLSSDRKMPDDFKCFLLDCCIDPLFPGGAAWVFVLTGQPQIIVVAGRCLHVIPNEFVIIEYEVEPVKWTALDAFQRFLATDVIR